MKLMTLIQSNIANEALRYADDANETDQADDADDADEPEQFHELVGEAVCKVGDALRKVGDALRKVGDALRKAVFEDVCKAVW